ncbi:MAG: hypothetical protein H8E15_16295 [Planctomycetes bacterium]|nr:hypothetical protein [Planctomycetota bacterium]
MNTEKFFAKAQAEFDARRDPLDRVDLVDWLEQNPEALDAFVNLRAVHCRLAAAAVSLAEQAPQVLRASHASQALQASQTPQALIRRWPFWVSLSAAAALLIFFSMPLKQTTQPQPADVVASLDTEEAPPLAMVISVKHSTSGKQTTITPTRSVQSNGASILSLSTTTRSVVIHSHP